MLLFTGSVLGLSVSSLKVGDQLRVTGTDTYPAFFHVPGHKAKPFIAKGMVGTVGKVYLPGSRDSGGSDHLDRSDERDILLKFTEPKSWQAHFCIDEVVSVDEDAAVVEVEPVLAADVDLCVADADYPCERVEQYMTPLGDALVLSPTMPMLEAAEALSAGRITGAPVAADGKLVGVLTAFDFLYQEIGDVRGVSLDSGKTVKGPSKWADTVKKAMAGTVAGAMSKPTAIAPGSDMAQVAGMMLSRRYNHVPVIESDGTLVGILTSQDVLRHVLQQRLRE